MSYRDHDYMSPTGTHPVGAHTTTGGSGWGVAIVLVFLLGILALAIVFGPEGEQVGATNDAPALQQTAPTANPTGSGDLAPAPAQSVD